MNNLSIKLTILFSFFSISLLSADCSETQKKYTEKKELSFKRIISLAPSNTETIFDVHGEKSLIGRSDACDYPPQAKIIPVVGRFLSLNLEKLVQLHPDMVLLVNGQEALAAKISKYSIPVRLFCNDKIEDISKNIRAIGQITGQTNNGLELARQFDNNLKQFNNIISKAKKRPKVFIAIWPEPLLTVGNSSFMNEAINFCGGQNIASNSKGAYPQMSPERLLMSKPEIVILPFEAQNQHFLERPPWTSLDAVKRGRVYFLPDLHEDCLSRPSKRLLSGLYWLSIRLHPELKTSLDKWKLSCP